MSRVGRTLAALAVLASAVAPLGLQPGRVHACSCVYSRTVGEVHLGDVLYSTVFAGTVQRVEPWDQKYSGELLDVDVTADHAWLGDLPANTTVRTVAAGASCGYSFEEGTRYLLFVARGQVSYCSPTQPYNDAAAQQLTALFGPGRDIAPETPHFVPAAAQTESTTSGRGGGSDAASLAFVVLASVAAAAGVVAVARRR